MEARLLMTNPYRRAFWLGMPKPIQKIPVHRVNAWVKRPDVLAELGTFYHNLPDTS
jgi:hypothetical protein